MKKSDDRSSFTNAAAEAVSEGRSYEGIISRAAALDNAEAT
jgi:hypothetical protein